MSANMANLVPSGIPADDCAQCDRHPWRHSFLLPFSFSCSRSFSFSFSSFSLLGMSWSHRKLFCVYAVARAHAIATIRKYAVTRAHAIATKRRCEVSDERFVRHAPRSWRSRRRPGPALGWLAPLLPSRRTRGTEIMFNFHAIDRWPLPLTVGRCR